MIIMDERKIDNLSVILAKYLNIYKEDNVLELKRLLNEWINEFYPEELTESNLIIEDNKLIVETKNLEMLSNLNYIFDGKDYIILDNK